MSLAEQWIDVQTRITQEDPAVANRISPGIQQQARGANLSPDARALEDFADADGIANLTHEVGREIASEIAHLHAIECGRCDHEIAIASAREVGVPGTRFEFGD